MPRIDENLATSEWVEVEGRRFRVIVRPDSHGRPVRRDGSLDNYVIVGLEVDPPYEGHDPLLYARLVRKEVPG